MTFFSPSAESVARRFGADFCDYLPFDTSRGADAALSALLPSALVYSKLDVWPVLTERAAANGVPIGMISATVRKDSSRRGFLSRALLEKAYAALDLVGAITEDDAERLVSLGVRRDNLRITGDTRYDQVWERASRIDPRGPLLAPLASARPTLVAGSTWPADEARVFDAWTAVRRKIPDARLIIAPHEPSESHVASIERWAASERLAAARVDADASAFADVIIVDRVGPLGELYALGWVAFVGGGFHEAGLHSVLEPAAAGVPVIAGPGENPDLARLVAVDAGRQVATASELALCAVEWLGDEGPGGARGLAAVSVIKANLGAADRATELVRSLRSTERKPQD
jgi:3-deoxy-D-manno-octulosonic-acid transferase